MSAASGRQSQRTPEWPLSANSGHNCQHFSLFNTFTVGWLDSTASTSVYLTPSREDGLDSTASTSLLYLTP